MTVDTGQQYKNRLSHERRVLSSLLRSLPTVSEVGFHFPRLIFSGCIITVVHASTSSTLNIILLLFLRIDPNSADLREVAPTLKTFLHRKYYDRAPVSVSTLKDSLLLGPSLCGPPWVGGTALHGQWPCGGTLALIVGLGGTGLHLGWEGPHVCVLWPQTKHHEAFSYVPLPVYFWEIIPWSLPQETVSLWPRPVFIHSRWASL